ncbi:MAG TPA: M56 family metallopeptidase [Longimicrobium sp.]|nr:M56 family metallopeptidase [Longimicrobium sp.]
MGDAGWLDPRVVDAVAAWLLTYAIHSTALLGAAWLASRGRIGEHLRETLWKLALAGALLTASAAQMRADGAAVRLAPVVSTAIAESPAPASPELTGIEARDAGAADHVGIAASGEGEGVRWTYVLVLVWLAGAAVSLGRLGAGWIGFTRRLARVPAEAGDPAAIALRELCAASGVRRPVRLTCSETLAAPVALLGGEICIPRNVSTRLDGEQRRAMLAHETAHLLRRDPLWLWAASVAASVFWFQPLLRTCLRGLRAAAEYQCDAWAAGRAGAFALARCLADVAAWGPVHPVPAPVAGMSARGAALVSRVERLLSDAPEPRVRRRWALAGVLAVATAAAYAPGVHAGEAAAQAPARQQSFSERFGISPALAAAVERAARAEGVDAELAFRLVHTESGFDERKMGPGGIGLTQIILPTARSLQPGITRRELLRRDTNLRLGLRYLHRMLVRYDGNVPRAVQAYYEGPRGLERDGPEADTRAYAARLLGSVAGLPAYRGLGLPATTTGAR